MDLTDTSMASLESVVSSRSIALFAMAVVGSMMTLSRVCLVVLHATIIRRDP